MTSLLVEHPGGKAILVKHLGKDATAAFRRAKHSPGTQIITANYRIRRAPAPAMSVGGESGSGGTTADAGAPSRLRRVAAPAGGSRPPRSRSM